MLESVFPIWTMQSLFGFKSGIQLNNDYYSWYKIERQV